MIFRKYILGMTAVMLIFSGCSNKPAVVVKAGLIEQVITAKLGDPFIVQLEGQLSTGYGWRIIGLPASLKVTKENVITEGKDKAGGIDIQEFIFKSIAKGDFTLTFKYAKHWEKKPQYIKTSTVKVRIE